MESLKVQLTTLLERQAASNRQILELTAEQEALKDERSSLKSTIGTLHQSIMDQKSNLRQRIENAEAALKEEKALTATLRLERDKALESLEQSRAALRKAGLRASEQVKALTYERDELQRQLDARDAEIRNAMKLMSATTIISPNPPDDDCISLPEPMKEKKTVPAKKKKKVSGPSAPAKKELPEPRSVAKVSTPAPDLTTERSGPIKAEGVIIKTNDNGGGVIAVERVGGELVEISFAADKAYAGYAAGETVQVKYVVTATATFALGVTKASR